MKKMIWLILACLVLMLSLLISCTSESPSQQTTSLPADVSSLSSQDVISIAQQHSVNSPLNSQEKQAGLYVSKGGTQGWHSDYIGNGKWYVELLVRSEDGSLTVYRWSVFETKLEALFLGVYGGSLIEYKSKYGHYPD
jgi:outer membrane lipoprotein-sorting protein